MRASKSVESSQHEVGRGKEIHISGAEGLYEDSEIQKVVKSYVDRALIHPKGKADTIAVTIEEIKRKPLEISSLPVATVDCHALSKAKQYILRILFSLGITKKAIDAAFMAINNGGMRGATVITSQKALRLEPDKKRGIRASRLGITRPASRILSLGLSRHDINTDTVKDALIIASKVISHRNVVAEVCVSDDPDYTTGYVASRKYGYVRIPHIKRDGSNKGGRAFFVTESTDIQDITHYMERVPVMIGNVSVCKGIITIDEILNLTHL